MHLPSLFNKVGLTTTHKPPAVHNIHQLEKLLIIENPLKESIFGILGRMEVLMDYFKSEPKLQGFIPFLKTYYLVTKASADKYVQVKHYFWSLRDYEMLDVYFASLYFKPMYQFLTSGEIAPPWKHYFNYCMSDRNNATLQIMLGVNAHINTDLPKALIDLRYHNQSDYFLVNNILEEVTPDVVKFLAADRYDLVGLSGIVFKDVISYEFGAVIVRWREEAWTQAHPLQNTKFDFDNVAKRTEQIATILIEDFDHIYHLHDVQGSIASINTLSVK